jgi:hypothetical protein
MSVFIDANFFKKFLIVDLIALKFVLSNPISRLRRYLPLAKEKKWLCEKADTLRPNFYSRKNENRFCLTLYLHPVLSSFQGESADAVDEWGLMINVGI